MAMKYRHTLDDGVGEVQNDIHGTAIGNINGVQPRWRGEWHTVQCIGQEVNLVNVEGMEFGSVVDNMPMLVRAHAGTGHRTRVRREFLAVDVKAVLVFCKCDNEIGRGFL